MKQRLLIGMTKGTADCRAFYESLYFNPVHHITGDFRIQSHFIASFDLYKNYVMLLHGFYGYAASYTSFLQLYPPIS